MCAKNAPGGKSSDTYFQYTSETVLNWYLNKEASYTYSGRSDTGKTFEPKIIDDCSKFTLGKLLGSTSGSSTPVPGDILQCTKDVSGGKGPNTYYQLTSLNKLNYTSDYNVAKSYSCTADSPKQVADCTTYKLGDLLSMNLNPPSCVGQPNGKNGSYGTENAPSAQIGKKDNSITDPMSRNNRKKYDQCEFLRKNGYNLPPACTGQPDDLQDTTHTLPSIDESSDQTQDWMNQLLPLLTASQTASQTASSISAPPMPSKNKQSLSAPAKPVRQEVTPEVSLSDTGYTALDLQSKSNLLKNIQKIVRDEIISSRNQPQNHPIVMGNDSDESTSESNAMQQGNEYKHHKHDMSKYIKKDSIPCWGCTLDY